MGGTNNDSQTQVNLDTMFGFNDWFFAQRDNGLDGTDTTTIDVGLTLTGDTQSGTWSINDIWGTYDDVMIVLKGGNGNNGNPNYLGYLLVDGDTSGTYNTPFFNAQGGGAGNPKNISHLSVYVRGAPTAVVPLPAAAWMGMVVLGGLGAVKKIRNSRSA